MFTRSDTPFARQFIKKRIKQSALLVLIGFISSCFTLLIPISVGKFYELALGYSSKRLQFIEFIPDQFWDTTEKFLIFFGVIVVLRFIFYFWFEFKLRNESDLFIKEIKDFLFGFQLDISMDTYKKKGTGKYLLRYTGDINSLKNLYRKGSISILIDVILVVLGVFALFQINTLGGAVVAISVLIGYGIVKLINSRLEKASLQKRNKTSVQVAFVNRILSGIISVKAFNRKEVELKRYSTKSSKVLEKAIKYNRWFVLNSAFIYLLQYMTLLAVLFVIYRYESSAKMNASALISFILLYITLIPSIRRVYRLESVMKLGKISERKLRNILDQDLDHLEGQDMNVNNPRMEIQGLKLTPKSKEINFVSEKKDICSVKIEDAHEVFKFMEALLQLYTDYQGEIMVNKTNIKDLNSPTLRSMISISSPKFPLVGKTVYEAIVEARSKETRDQVEELFTFFKERMLPNSNLTLDSKIGENGSDLTLIEKELLSLVRGFANNLRSSKFVIIDKYHLLELESNTVEAILPLIDKTIIVLDYE